jgi:ribosomal protein S18 acetylase RimI-like enzyme
VTGPGAVRGTIRRAVPEELSVVSTVLSRAFHDDPVTRWAIPEPDRRRRLLPRLFELFARALQRHDEIYLAPDATGAAIWAPAAEPVSGGEAERFEQRVEALVGADAPRLAEIAALLAEHHPHGSYFYLQFVGVDPAWQGKGLGSALLAPVLRRCDRERVSAYLEASSERNRRLYERLGFEAVGVLAPPGGPPLWPMWRLPAAW